MSKVTTNDLKEYIPDLVADFLYYNRKNDEELTVAMMEEAMESGEIDVDALAECFREELNKHFE